MPVTLTRGDDDGVAGFEIVAVGTVCLNAHPALDHEEPLRTGVPVPVRSSAVREGDAVHADRNAGCVMGQALNRGLAEEGCRVDCPDWRVTRSKNAHRTIVPCAAESNRRPYAQIKGEYKLKKIIFSVVCAIVAILGLAGASEAQPPGITREMIATALPVEGAPLAEPGPYKVMSELAFGSPGHVVYRPADLAPFPAKDTLPVMVWGNGGCAINSTRYGGFLTTIASHGFVVLATAAEPGTAAGTRATADNLRKAIGWAETENKRAGSPLNGKINLDRVAVMGQSCGGFLSIELGADPRVDTIGVFNSGAQGDNVARLGALHGPVLLINGHERDFLMASSKATFDAIDKLPAFYGARHGAGHTATVDHPGGGEWANVASSWLRWQFKGNKQAAKMFVGKDCSLCTNSTWDTASKRLD
jgi:hypothetical protein